MLDAVYGYDDRFFSEVLRVAATMRADAQCLELGPSAGEIAAKGRRTIGRWTVVRYAGLPEVLQSKSGDLVPRSDRLPFASASFDFVVASSLLTSAAEPVALLKELSRVLAPEGTVVVAEPVLGDYAGIAEDWYAELHRLLGPTTGRPFTTAELLAAVRSSGLSALYSVEFRRMCEGSLNTWLHRVASSGGSQEQSRLRELVGNPPAAVVGLGLRLSGDRLDLPVCWALAHAHHTASVIARSLVVSLIPVKVEDGQLQIYVQQRRTPVVSEPEFIGYMEFPQGHVETNESIADAARRELSEEAGLVIGRVFGTEGFVASRRYGPVLVEETQPTQVIVTSGRLNFVSLVFIVEIVGQSTPRGPVDNRGRWVSERDFASLSRTMPVYPLNRPMMTLITERSEWIRRQLAGSDARGT